MIELDQNTGLPSRDKMSKISVQLDKTQGGIEIAEIDFNMADFTFGEYKNIRLQLNKCEGNQTIEI